MLLIFKHLPIKNFTSSFLCLFRPSFITFFIIFSSISFGDYQYSKEQLLECDRQAASISPNTATQKADRWYETGAINIAFEFDHLYAQNYPYMANNIADKWHLRGHNEISLQFDKLYLKNDLLKTALISKKWFTRDNVDIAYELDFYAAKALPFMAHELANEWYDRQCNDLGFEFDILFLKNDPRKSPEIAHTWHLRGEHDFAFELEKAYPLAALSRFDNLIKNSLCLEADFYANQMLKHWLSENDEQIQNSLNDKLKLAVKIESPDYKILRTKLSKINRNNIFHNYLPFLENLPLNSKPTQIQCNNTTTLDSLIDRIYISPDLLKAQKISIETARAILEFDLYELAQKNPIISSILHALAIFAKANPDFKLHIFHKNPFNEKSFGIYRPIIKQVNIHSRHLGSLLFRKTLIHEWTHQLMDILFSNFSNPYFRNDDIAQTEWNNIMQAIWRHLADAQYVEDTDPNIDGYKQALISFNKIKLYQEEFHHSEAIARYAEMLAINAFEDPKTKKLLKSVNNFWIQYLTPIIEKYIAENSFVIDGR